MTPPKLALPRAAQARAHVPAHRIVRDIQAKLRRVVSGDGSLTSPAGSALVASVSPHRQRLVPRAVAVATRDDGASALARARGSALARGLDSGSASAPDVYRAAALGRYHVPRPAGRYVLHQNIGSGSFGELFD